MHTIFCWWRCMWSYLICLSRYHIVMLCKYIIFYKKKFFHSFMIFFFKTFEWQKKLLTLTLIVLYWETCFHKSWIATGQDCFSKEGKWNAVWLRVSLLNSLLKPKDVLTTPNCCCCLAHSGQKYGKMSRKYLEMSQKCPNRDISRHFRDILPQKDSSMLSKCPVLKMSKIFLKSL